MTLLYLVRHGDTYFEPERRIKGRLDVPLSPHGWEQARAVAAYFRGMRADVVYCSTLRRTQEGARLIARAVGRPTIIATPLLDEASWGLWQGLTTREVMRERAAGGQPSGRYAPLGEGRESMALRVAAFLSTVAWGRSGQTVVAVTHGGVIKNAVLSAIGLPLSNRTAFTAETGTVSLLEYDGDRWAPVFLNSPPVRTPSGTRPQCGEKPFSAVSTLKVAETQGPQR